jgi:glycine/D-amino acid oxidase-like deaminating enzyme/nitrite reductase/ring-hydroxylating ferredoxin subunit
VPYATRGAVAVDDQGQFDPTPFLASLADEVESLGGRVVEGTRAVGVRDRGRGAVVRTAGGDVRAGWVVMATHLPFLDRSLLFARAEPKASYAMAVRTGGRLPEGMLLSAGEPTRSLRTAPDPDRPGERLLIVGGEGHKTGGDGPTSERYQALLDWASERFAVEDVPWRWSTEDYVPDDSLPFVGPVWPLPTNVLVATGYAKWGFTNGPAAAMAMVARITGEPLPDWADDWDTRRLDLRKGAKEAIKANADVAAKLVGGWAKGVARSRRVPPTVSATVDGTEHQVRGVCTHLGGIVRWNDGDRCWDCPLHGSKFDADGTLLHGPAVKDLERA